MSDCGRQPSLRKRGDSTLKKVFEDTEAKHRNIGIYLCVCVCVRSTAMDGRGRRDWELLGFVGAARGAEHQLVALVQQAGW